MADLDPQALTYAWMRYVRMSMTQAIDREDFGEIIQAYLAALPKGEPGWKLVPVEPTEKMCRAGESCDGNSGPGPWLDGGYDPENVELIYKAMIAAAPPTGDER